MSAASHAARWVLALAAALGAGACAGVPGAPPLSTSAPSGARAPAPTPSEASSAAHASLLATAPPSAAAPSSPAVPSSKDAGAAARPAALTFVEDDYPRALAEARAKGRRLFVDAWAPWCHTCLSMRAYVFGDPALAARADDFVWLALDTEKPANAPFLAKYPMTSWPTLWVVDPATETPVLKWPGAATAQELAALLDDARSGAPARGEAAAALVRGKQAAAANEPARAIAELRAAVAAAPAGWARRPQAIEALAFALQANKDLPACVDLARAELARLPPGTSKANVALVGLGCASDAKRAADVAALAAATEAIARDPAFPILVDDRSGLFEALVEAYHAAEDPRRARELARPWAELLDREADRAPTRAARAVFDAHRLLAYLELGEPAKAVAFLTASERDFPDDYNPPARLARAYLAAGRHDEALAAVDRALARVYGPRELRLHALRADVLAAKGDVAGAKAALARGVARADAMKALPGSYARAKDDMAKRLRAMEKAAGR